MIIDIAQLHWAAGFLEGEGTFGWVVPTSGIRHGTKDYGKPYRNPGTVKIGANQVQAEPLQRLAKLFGGRVRGPYVHRGKLGTKPLYYWSRAGRPAAGIMMTLWTLMSPRRQDQIAYAITNWGRAEKRDA